MGKGNDIDVQFSMWRERGFLRLYPDPGDSEAIHRPLYDAQTEAFLKTCNEQKALGQMRFVLKGHQASFYCTALSGEVFSRKGITAPDSYRKLFFSKSPEERSDRTNTQLAIDVLWFPRIQEVEVKLASKKKLTWDELYAVAKAKNRSIARAANLLEGKAPLELVRPLEKLNGLPLLELRSLAGMLKFRALKRAFPDAFSETVENIYSAASSSTLPDEDSHKTALIGEVLTYTAKAAFECLDKHTSPRFVDFFLSEIVQKPRPEVDDVIDTFIRTFNSLPTFIQDRARRFFEKELDLPRLMVLHYDYYPSCQSVPKLLAMAAIEFDREDARKQLENIVLENLELGNTDPFEVYLQNFIEKELEPGAYQFVQRILLGRIVNVSQTGRMSAMKSILERDNAFYVFQIFLSGRKVSDPDNPDRSIQFNMNYFLTVDVRPPCEKNGHFYRLTSPQEKMAIQETYRTLMGAVLKRKYFKVYGNHLSFHYDDWNKSSEYEKYRIQLILEAMQYTEMHDFLYDQVNAEGAHLGYAILKTALVNIRHRLAASDSEQRRSVFFSRLKSASLGSIDARLRAETERNFGTGAVFYETDIPAMAVEALEYGFSRAKDFLRGCISSGELHYRYLYFSNTAMTLPLNPHVEEPNYSIGTSTSTSQSDAVKGDVQELRAFLTQLDLSFVADLTRQLYVRLEQASDAESQQKAEESLLQVAERLNNMKIFWKGFQNETVLETFRGFVELEPVTPIDCARLDSLFESNSAVSEHVLRGMRSLRYGWLEEVKSDDANISSRALEQLSRLVDFLQSSLDTDSEIAYGGVQILSNFSNIDGSRDIPDFIEARARGGLHNLASTRRGIAPYALYQIAYAEKMRSKNGRGEGHNSVLESVNLSALPDPNCTPESKDAWTHQKYNLLALLSAHGNQGAYAELRQIFAKSFVDYADRTSSAESFRSFNDRTLASLGQAAMDLVEMAALGAVDGQLMQQMAGDFSYFYTVQKEMIDTILVPLSQMRDMPGGQLFNPSSNPSLSATQKLIEIAKGDWTGYAFLSLLALTDIPELSEAAQEAMQSIPRSDQRRQRVYETYSRLAGYSGY